MHLNVSSAQVHSVDQPGYDRYFKVRKLLDWVTPKFEEEYIPQGNDSLQTKTIFKQYMKDKPVKWGIDVFVLSDAHNRYRYGYKGYRIILVKS